MRRKTKPSCVRCTSTGRTCDGYGVLRNSSTKKESSFSNHQTTSFQVRKHHEQAHAKYLAECASNPQLRLFRPLVAGISGTEKERRFFHNWSRDMGVLAFHPSTNLDLFWRTVVPQIGHHDDAVKHSLIALGAAYQLFMRKQERHNPQHESFVRDDAEADGLEPFSIMQNNKAIQALQRHAVLPTPDSLEITLVCCLIFICIEAARDNERGFVVHVAKGLQIIDTYPIELLQDVWDIELPKSKHHHPRRERRHERRYKRHYKRHYDYGRILSKSDWRQLIAWFSNIEISTPIKPSICKKLREIYRMGPDSIKTALVPDTDFTSGAQMYETLMRFSQAVYGFIYETRLHKGDVAFWSRAANQATLNSLHADGERLCRLVDRFLTSPYMPQPSSLLPWMSVKIDDLYVKGHRALIKLMPHALRRRDMASQRNQLLEHLGFIQHIIDVCADPARIPPLVLDNSVLNPLYIILYIAPDRECALRCLRFWRGKREAVFAASTLERVLAMFRNQHGHGHDDDMVTSSAWDNDQDQLLDDMVGPVMNGLGGLPGLERSLTLLRFASS